MVKIEKGGGGGVGKPYAVSVIIIYLYCILYIITTQPSSNGLTSHKGYKRFWKLTEGLPEVAGLFSGDLLVMCWHQDAGTSPEHCRKGNLAVALPPPVGNATIETISVRVSLKPFEFLTIVISFVVVVMYM